VYGDALPAAGSFVLDPEGESMRRPRMRLAGPVLDSADPLALADFYARFLGWPVVEREGPRPGYPTTDGWAKIRSPEQGLKIEFQYEEHYAPPVWPPTGNDQQMMIHLDIGVGDLDTAVAWALTTGATLAAHQPQEGVRVLLDPDGHPFCLFPDPGLR
jgi:catechol 2,3-dioxygenase-like lactoylglutathione lyase family enzyme